MSDPELLVDAGDQLLHFAAACRWNLHVEGASQMQRLDLCHPGEGELIVGPLALGDDGDLVVAGTLERPVVMRGNILDRRERVASGINNAFEHGHAVSTSVSGFSLIRDTGLSGPYAGLTDA